MMVKYYSLIDPMVEGWVKKERDEKMDALKHAIDILSEERDQTLTDLDEARKQRNNYYEMEQAVCNLANAFESERNEARAVCTLLAHQRDRLLRLLHTACAERDADIEAGRRWSRLYVEERDKRVALAKQARAWKVLAWSLRYWVRTKSGKTAPNIPGSIEQTMRAHNANRDFRRENGEARRARRAKRQEVG